MNVNADQHETTLDQLIYDSSLFQYMRILAETDQGKGQKGTSCFMTYRKKKT